MSAQAAATDGCESRSQPETAGDSERTRMRIVYDAEGADPDPKTGDSAKLGATLELQLGITI